MGGFFFFFFFYIIYNIYIYSILKIHTKKHKPKKLRVAGCVQIVPTAYCRGDFGRNRNLQLCNFHWFSFRGFATNAKAFCLKRLGVFGLCFIREKQMKRERDTLATYTSNDYSTTTTSLVVSPNVTVSVGQLATLTETITASPVGSLSGTCKASV